jgi:hypothetical protein
MDELLPKFGAIFVEPSDLSPPCQQCYHIQLLSGTTLISVRRGSYTHGQKVELERQCTDMLQQGVIRPSSLAFSAPLLLVKKSDSSWSLCVDYRALDDRTVRTSS